MIRLETDNQLESFCGSSRAKQSVAYRGYGEQRLAKAQDAGQVRR